MSSEKIMFSVQDIISYTRVQISALMLEQITKIHHALHQGQVRVQFIQRDKSAYNKLVSKEEQLAIIKVD